MPMVDLAAELAYASDAMKAGHIARLRALRAWHDPFATSGIHGHPLGVARVLWRSGGIYEPDESGDLAVILPVGWPASGTLTAPHWYLVDLVAFCPASPDRWALRTGNGWALGGHMLEHWEGDPVAIVETPLDWLRAGADAVCVLDWANASQAWPLLRMVSELVVGDHPFARKLAAAIDRTAPRPRLSVEGRRHAA